MYSLKHGNGFAFHASLLFFCAIFVICCSDDGNKATDHRQQPDPTLADTTACPLVKVNAERLPELNIPRAGHNMFYAGDELTVVGGHTIGFKPTATAEYYKDGQWHQLPTEYPHDNGLAVPLTAGKVLLAGGHSEPIGIGQSYLVESYDPASHTCTGFSSLYTKRTLAQGIELDSGRVVIVGNHFHHDAIELFDGKKTFSLVKEVAVERMCPYIFRTSDGDVIILGAHDTRYQPVGSSTVDRMKGTPFSVPLLDEWQPMPFERSFSSDVSFIGDEQEGDYSYLLPVVNSDRQLAISLVRDTVFTLLPTDCVIPMAPFGDSILYDSPAIADRQVQRAYVVGRDMRDRYYFLSIDYAQMPADKAITGSQEKAWHAKLKLFYTDPMPDMGCTIPVLTPDGNLLITGGVNQSHDNFAPLSTVWLMHVNSEAPVLAESCSYAWLWVIVAVALLSALAYIIINRKRHKPIAESLPDSQAPATPSDEELMQRICQFLEQDQHYLQSRLRLTDVATSLNISVSTVTNVLAQQRGTTFAQLVGEYRVRHAQQLLREQPDMKIVIVSSQAGFTSETTFFRTFKAVTGLSPREWLAQYNEQN